MVIDDLDIHSLAQANENDEKYISELETTAYRGKVTDERIKLMRNQIEDRKAMIRQAGIRK